MCSMPPFTPPPPPAPPLSLRLSSHGTPKSAPTASDQFSNTCQLLETDLCMWASSEPELRRACIFGPICKEKPPFRMKYNSFESIIQVGPTCGLVALSMLVHGKITPDEILNMSKTDGYTSNGEMFSCRDMARLAQKVFESATEKNISVTVNSRSLFSPDTVESLLNGDVLLVPYDADVNHRPAMKNGHTAHWALVCGVILLNEPEAYSVDKENVHVLCRHGKSKYLCAWNLAELSQSNNNLWEFSPKKQNDGLTYVLPDGGIGGKNGLRGQYITVQWNKLAEVKDFRD